MSQTPPQSCEKCGAKMAAPVLGGLCPGCVAAVAFGPEPNSPTTRRQMPLPDFEGYQVLEEIGRGGMGVVFKARQAKLDRIVALKTILAGRLASAGEVERLRAEAQAAAHLQHPNIVAIHEIGELDGLPYFSMDYVEGRSLAQLVHDGPLTPTRAATYVKTLAEAIAYAHEQGILHRDLKPSNVLIDKFDEPRVTDFGLAKRLLSESQLNTQLTVTGQVIGTPSFIPPEQAGANNGEPGPASDIYSMGALLYFLLTARPPFLGATLEETLARVLNAEPETPRVLNRVVPRDLETICMRCLQKEAARRYPSAQELADDLGRFLRHEPILARPVAGLEKAWRWCRKRPAVASLGMSLGATLAALLLVLGLVYAKRGPMHIPVLAGNGACATIDGQIYVVIPSVGDGPGLHLFYAYDAVRNSWSAPLPAVPLVHDHGCAGAIDRKIYVAGGSNQQGALDKLDIYDPALNQWTSGAPMKTPRVNCAAAVLNGMLYVLGGTSGGDPSNTLSSVEIYDPKTGSWTSGPTMPTARFALGAAVMDGTLYAVAGRDRFSDNLPTLEALGADGIWVPLASAPTPVADAFVAARDGILYLAGGRGGPNETLALVQAYSARTGKWTVITRLPDGRMDGCGAQWSGGELYFFGGWSMTDRLPRSDVFVYNPARNTWRH